MPDKPLTKTQLLAELKKARDRIAFLEARAEQGKPAGKGLASSSETLESIIRNLPHIVYQLDPQGRIKFISPSVTRYGYQAQDLVGRAILDLIHPEDHPKARFKARERRRGERRTDSLEVRLISLGGGAAPAEIRVLLSAEGVYSYDRAGSKKFIGTQGIIRDVTDLVEARQELEIKNSAVDSAISGLALADLKGGLTYLNQAGLEMLGFHRLEEVLKRPITGFTSQRELARLVVGRLINEQTWTGEIQFIKKDGSRIPVQLSANVVKSAEGRTLCWLFNFLDMTRRNQMEDQLRQARDDLDIKVQERTAELHDALCNLRAEVMERKKAEEALSTSNELLEKIFSTTHISLAYLDRDLNFLRVNRRFARQAGHPPRFFEGSNLNAVFPEKTRRLCDRVIATGRPHISQGQPDLFTLRPGERKTYWDLTIQPMTDQKGGVEGLLVGAMEATERVEAEAERALMAAVIEQAEELAMITLPEGEIIYANPAVKPILGLGPKEIIGRGMLAFLGRGLDGSQAKEVARALSARQSWSGSLTWWRRDGGRSELQVTIFPLRDGKGEVTHMAVIGLDLTQERRLARKLRQRQKLEAVGTLAGGIAHDFNNILGPIIGYSEMTLLDLEPRDPAREPLEEILQAGLRAKDLVNQILTFSRRTERNATNLELQPIIKEVLKLIRASLPSTVEIELNLSPTGLTVKADPTQIHQVLVNLCTNAGQAMQEEGGTLGVLLEEATLSPEAAKELGEISPGRYLTLMVSDTGKGMDQQTLSRIFEPFFTTRTMGEGTGLGLSVVHGIVQETGGAITVESEPGQGTVFRIYLPAQEVSTEAAAEQDQEPPHGTENILLVEDEPSMAALGSKLLRRLGYQVEPVVGSQEALALFRSRPAGFDLVITDQTMPKLTGTDLAQELKRLRPDIPIILCTGFEAAAGIERAQECGIQSIVYKPYQAFELAEAVRSALDDKS